MDGVREELLDDTKALGTRLREVEQELIRIQTKMIDE